MENPNTLEPGYVIKKIPYQKDQYIPAFYRGKGRVRKLMFASRKGSFKSATLATQRSTEIWNRWRQAYTDSINAMMAQAQAVPEKKHVVVEPDNLVIEVA